mmetsp:Transcript_85161/g.189288  ORF Transcript_85161/g.189288 Transcript_85161/m.189288 type:complete len:425 (-) Transcript_85161:1770-3044(-)
MLGRVLMGRLGLQSGRSAMRMCADWASARTQRLLGHRHRRRILLLDTRNLLRLLSLAHPLLDENGLLLPLEPARLRLCPGALRQPAESPPRALDADDLGQKVEAAVADEESPGRGLEHRRAQVDDLCPEALPQSKATRDALDVHRRLYDALLLRTGHLAGKDSATQSLDPLSRAEAQPGTLELRPRNLTPHTAHPRAGHVAPIMALYHGGRHLAAPDLLELILPEDPATVPPPNALNLQGPPELLLRTDRLTPHTHPHKEAPCEALGRDNVCLMLLELAHELPVPLPRLRPEPHLPQERRCLVHALQLHCPELVRAPDRTVTSHHRLQPCRCHVLPVVLHVLLLLHNKAAAALEATEVALYVDGCFLPGLVGFPSSFQLATLPLRDGHADGRLDLEGRLSEEGALPGHVFPCQAAPHEALNFHR